jgi:hypothetical protein
MKQIRKAATKPDAQHQSARPPSVSQKITQGDLAPYWKRVGINEIKDINEEMNRQKLAIWLSRRRVHASSLDTYAALLIQEFGSVARFEHLKELLAAYHKTKNLEDYVRLRRSFPELEIDIALLAGGDAFRALRRDCKKYGLDMGVVTGACYGYVHDMDELSLRLMELLIAWDKLPKSGPDHASEKRQEANCGTLVDYLIAKMLESMQWNERRGVFPSSLIVLIRYRLCGSDPKLPQRLLATVRDEELTHKIYDAVALADKKISIRKLASTLGVNKNRVAQVLADPDFKHNVNARKRSMARDAQQRSVNEIA